MRIVNQINRTAIREFFEVLKKKEFRNFSTDVLFLLMIISNTIHLWTLITEFLDTFDLEVYSNVFF
jgi:hypothetical protein